MVSPESPQKTCKLSWRAKARLRAGLQPRTRGGQPGNSNRLLHGRYTGHYRERRAAIQDLVRSTNALIARIKLAAKFNSPLQQSWRGLSEAKGAGLARKRFETVPATNAASPQSPLPSLRSALSRLRPERGIFSKTSPSLRAYLAATEGHP